MHNIISGDCYMHSWEAWVCIIVAVIYFLPISLIPLALIRTPIPTSSTKVTRCIRKPRDFTNHFAIIVFLGIPSPMQSCINDVTEN